MVDINNTQQFLDYSIPLIYVKQLSALQNSGSIYAHPVLRFWLSQPRRMDDATWEILTVNFRNPVSISQISFELLEINQQWEFWYYDSQNRRLPILDTSLRQFSGFISTGGITTWYAFLNSVYPIVATKVEFRIKRVQDAYLDPAGSYAIGVKNLLFKRTIYNRDDAVQPLGNEVDPIGNLVQKFIQDWEPSQAIDGNATTFWKSAPQPDPNAVACFYLDCRDSGGNAQRIDRMWMNPVYTGQLMNLYYSSDDTIGQRILNNTFLSPISTTNAPQTDGIGLDLTATTALYTLSTASLGLTAGSSIWVGGTWKPNFGSSSPPPSDLMIFQDTTNSFHVKYRFATNSFEVKWGTQLLTTPIVSFNANSEINFAFRVIFPNDPSGASAGLYFDVVDASGTIMGSAFSVIAPTINPIQTSFTLAYCSGVIERFFIKQEGATSAQVYSALQNTSIYIKPTPAPDLNQGVVVTLSTANMVYGADFTQDELGYGGLDNEFFTQKQWTPMWVDWTVEKGFYYFPLPISCKYIKLEFYGLTEEPYPIYESGISVEYQTFPLDVLATSVSVLNQTTDTFTSQNTQISSLNGVLYNNYYQSSTYNQTTTNFPQNLTISVGSGTLSTTPNLFNSPITTTVDQETTSSVYYRSTTSTSVQDVAADRYYTVVSGDWLIKIGREFNIDWQAIYNANKSLIATDPRVALLPHRSPGWWIFPGQVLRIPASIMNQITTTSTNTEKKVSSTTTTTTRTRFTTTQIHRYDVRTVERDAAIAYFAGINEIQVYKVNYTTAYDTEKYIIPSYDTTQFTMTNMQSFSTGAWKALSTSSIGQIVSAEFDSMSFFQRIKFVPYDRGLHRPISGINLTPISLGGQVASTWADSTATWADPISTWGGALNLLSINFSSNQFFAGRTAAFLSRPAGFGAGGIASGTFALQANTRVRIGTDYFLTNINSPNPLVAQLVDMSTGGTGTVLASYTIPTNVSGQWVSYKSPFFTLTTAKSSLNVRILVEGTAAESLYIADIYPEITTILYELSNNAGTNWYDITEEAYNTGNTFFVFPSLDRRLKVRVTLNDSVNDFVYGFSATPTYIAW